MDPVRPLVPRLTHDMKTHVWPTDMQCNLRRIHWVLHACLHRPLLRPVQHCSLPAVSSSQTRNRRLSMSKCRLQSPPIGVAHDNGRAVGRHRARQVAARATPSAGPQLPASRTASSLAARLLHIRCPYQYLSSLISILFLLAMAFLGVLVGIRVRLYDRND